ncbi:hypothetical protein Pedsa_3540 [Pseudopedobacter saltans DSM 12145]|uniref:Uncharacterized protein n=1 Tax=Pseudopedobacter saltans (strain ATCC 51119 / DSM 12145 / JCM 21818 / CCUG 39354 / LMG 10337 / NBRC 100064 / NCIMB 13643) TaxID=762903 RepID=F0SF02_PSESL|nr:hypothetical protein Pedsa_3540 [Pseudopedobacter saltans DSM 12145]
MKYWNEFIERKNSLFGTRFGNEIIYGINFYFFDEEQPTQAEAF